ncbi:MAG: hypothetical protein GWN58_20575 [Anaerolineae bacterium]|nr:hypothetical protein [Anaerolineae bacterium]
MGKGDLIDKGLAIGAGFDWISPLLGFAGDLMNGPSHGFLVPYDSCPMSGKEIARLLRERGVKTWGMMIVSGTLMFSVQLKKARWAQHILEQRGVPIENPIAGNAKQPKQPRKARGAASPFRVFDIFD